MTDTSEKKTILVAIRNGLHWLLHMALVPVVALLKALVAGFTYLHDELVRI
jgi:hypothetical protein